MAQVSELTAGLLAHVEGILRDTDSLSPEMQDVKVRNCGTVIVDSGEVNSLQIELKDGRTVNVDIYEVE